MGRKFLLVGLFVTLAPGSILQITVGAIVAAAYLMVQLNAKPWAPTACPSHGVDDRIMTTLTATTMPIAGTRIRRMTTWPPRPASRC